MSRTTIPLTPDTVAALRMELLSLAKAEEELAATEAARTPYWRPLPTSVEAHRAAAAALRANAGRLDPAA